MHYPDILIPLVSSKNNLQLVDYIFFFLNKNSYVGIVPENCFCPVCNVYVNRIKRSRPFDNKEHNTFSSDGIKERWCPVDRLQTLRAYLHQPMDHSSENFLKLNPFPVLDTDPTLNNLNYSNALSKFPHLLS